MIRNVFFVDSRMANHETLLAAMPADSAWHVLDAGSDGVGQMRAVLAGYEGLASIQIVSHGSPGTLFLGSSVLDSATLTDHAAALEEIGRSLAPEGDILLYGCNVAQGDAGQDLIRRIAGITGADVAASSDLTGGTASGGNWTLEATAGLVQAQGLVA